jgi:hypothetical protein
MKIAVTLSLLATASAFAPASKGRASVAVQETKVSFINCRLKSNEALFDMTE